MSVAASRLPGARATPAERTRHLRVAPEVARRRRRAQLAIVIGVLVTVASLLMVVTFQVFAAQSAFKLDRLAKEHTNEELRNERLRAEVAQESSPGSIIARAESAGLVPAPVVWVQAIQAAPTHPVSDFAQEVLASSWPTTKKNAGAAP
jgi:hypothetical protein